MKPQNKVAMEFNWQLEDKISQLRTQLPFAKFTYVNVYSAKYALISNAKNLGEHIYFDNMFEIFSMLALP